MADTPSPALDKDALEIVMDVARTTAARHRDEGRNRLAAEIEGALSVIDNAALPRPPSPEQTEREGLEYSDMPDDPEITRDIWGFVKANFVRPTTDRSFYTLMAILESRRRTPAPDALEAAVEGTRRATVKTLEWEGIDSTSMWANVKPFWLQYRIALQADRMKRLTTEWLGNRSETIGVFAEWDEAKAAAQADFADRILSALDIAALPAKEPTSDLDTASRAAKATPDSDHRFVVVSSDYVHPFLLGSYATIELATRAQSGRPDKWDIFERYDALNRSTT